jgi:hypothetical protein
MSRLGIKSVVVLSLRDSTIQNQGERAVQYRKMWNCISEWFVNPLDNARFTSACPTTGESFRLISQSQWCTVRNIVQKPLLAILHYGINEEVSDKTMHWSCLLFTEAKIQVARKTTRGRSEVQTRATKRRINKESISLPSTVQPKKVSVQSGSGRGQGGKGLGVSELALSPIELRPSRSIFVLSDLPIRPTGVILLIFLAGTFSKCGGQKMAERWRHHAVVNNLVLGVVEARSTFDTFQNIAEVCSKIRGAYPDIPGYREVSLHFVTHSSQFPAETHQSQGRVLWYGDTLQEAQSLSLFLRYAMVFAKSLRTHNLLISLACCSLERAIQSSPFLRNQLEIWTQELGIVTLTVLMSCTPELSETKASCPEIWIPLIMSWMTDGPTRFELPSDFQLRMEVMKVLGPQ